MITGIGSSSDPQAGGSVGWSSFLPVVLTGRISDSAFEIPDNPKLRYAMHDP